FLAGEDHRHVLFSKRLQPILDLRGEGSGLQEEPRFIEDEQGRLAVEATLKCVKQHCERRTGGVRTAHEIVHFERLDATVAERGLVVVEQASVRASTRKWLKSRTDRYVLRQR